MSDKWKLAPGLNFVGAYQVSGIPFCSGAVDATNAYKIEFPYVTRWVIVRNRHTVNDLKVGFSEAGVRADGGWTGAGYTAGTNYFVLPEVNTAGAEDRSSIISPLELKISEIWLSGSSNVDVIAGLTYINPTKLNTADGSSWSGSHGVG
tara:strand:- start:24 stop:470 length:447 start_codon:yes stop_codon:yes gene_type:complete